MQNSVKNFTCSDQVDTLFQMDEQNVDKQLSDMVNQSKINATLKKAAVANFSTNLDNVYLNGKNFLRNSLYHSEGITEFTPTASKWKGQTKASR